MPTSWNLPPLRSGRPPDDQTKAHRAGLEQNIATVQTLHDERPHVPRREVVKGGVACWEVGDADARATVVYLHGGGFSLGHPKMWLRYAARIAEEAEVRIVLPRYRLAPEDPFPAGLTDAIAVFSAVAEEAGTKPIVVMGESAGASLTASLLAAAAASGQRYPDAAIIISPVLDFSIVSSTYTSHAAVDSWVSDASLKIMRENYLQGHPHDNPLVSAILSDVSSFPPVQLFCGGREVLLDDTIAFARKLALADRMVEAHFIANAEHGWSFVKPESPEAKVTMTHIVRFIRSMAAPAAAS